MSQTPYNASFKFYFLTFVRVYSQQNLIHVHHNLYKVEGRYSWLVLATPHRYRTFYQKKFSFDTQQRFCWINLIIWENIFSRTGLLRDRSQYRLSTIQYNFMLITHQEKIGAHQEKNNLLVYMLVSSRYIGLIDFIIYWRYTLQNPFFYYSFNLYPG